MRKRKQFSITYLYGKNVSKKGLNDNSYTYLYLLYEKYECYWQFCEAVVYY